MQNLTYSHPESLEQISLLEEFLDILPLKYRTIVALAYFTSSRINDILSLKVSDIKADQIIINQSEFGKAKCVPILSTLKPYLTVYLNGLYQKNSDFIFPDKLGKPMKISSVFKVLKLVAQQVNLPEMYLFVLS
ncbi:tyrosine-type recombinase/integrase [Crocosphaera sp. XPORK-15E]|uniref:tyrosine-type recombinase/integrase n=1 Tax=Crocosphaera sp. XPORK-15E TaxID=3110247 RepID=UPI002B20A7FC|nr:tyrosine-type recombinase/integrase [Crocosphaera sp. XPORK-15E]MEA5534795.1 tyrosine-type recombinase/integrase [Crocosphaera sp. XPORK-15E]